MILCHRIKPAQVTGTYRADLSVTGHQGPAGLRSCGARPDRCIPAGRRRLGDGSEVAGHRTRGAQQRTGQALVDERLAAVAQGRVPAPGLGARFGLGTTKSSRATVRLPPDGAEPPFVLIAKALRDAIRERTDGYRPGDKLPSYRELARTFGVAVGTVQNALRLLRQDGLLVSRAGSGVFVRSDLDAMGCPLALTPPVALHHPAAVGYGETIYMVIALLSDVLTDAGRQMLLAGLAAHDISDSAQGRDEAPGACRAGDTPHGAAAAGH